MKIEVTGRHLLITPAIRSAISRRLRKFVKICGDETSFHVIVDVEKDRHTAEILLRSKLLNITGKGETDDLYSSILRAVEKLEKQALKQKSKIIETKRQRAKEVSVREKTGRLVRRQAVLPGRQRGIVEEEAPNKPLGLEEAVLELGQSEYPFVVFRNADTGSVDVLYRRKDGALALIHS